MNLPIDYLYKLIPSGVISEDVRNLLQAVVSGFQGSVSDMRALASQIQQIWTPTNTVGEPFTVLQVSYTEDDGGAVRQIELSPDDTTPDLDSPNLNSWCATQAGVSIDQILTIIPAIEPARTAEIRTLLLLADTVGAKLYPVYGQTAAQTIASQKIVVKGYFARLKIKGGAKSFEILGKLHGFDSVKYSPLWGRVSPRIPNAVNDTDNDLDFSESPQGLPTPGQTTSLYDIQVLNDGDLFVWSSTNLGTVQGETDYALDLVNGFNPYIKIVAVNSPLKLPAAGTYFMSRGAPGTKAISEIIPAADGTSSNFQFQAIAESASFNTAQIVVANTIQAGVPKFTITVYHNLSSIKFVTSYFNLAVTALLSAYATQFSRPTIPSLDLTSTPGLWSLANLGNNQPVGFENGGTAISPYYYWTGGHQLPQVAKAWPTAIVLVGSGQTALRIQADSSFSSVDTGALSEAEKILLGNIDDVRPATRYLRNLSAGFSLDDDAVGYAPFVQSKNLILWNSGGVGSLTNVGISGIDYPIPPYVASFYVTVDGTRYPVTGEYSYSNLNIINFNYAFPLNPGRLSFNGYYDLAHSQFDISVTEFGSGAPCLFSAVWQAIGTDRLQETTRQLL